MESRKRPMIYLLISKKDEMLAGYYTNAECTEFHPFTGLDDLLRQLIPLVNGSYFKVVMEHPKEYWNKSFPRFSRLFIVEVMYRQHDDWQGCVHGLKNSNKTFKNRNELKEKLLCENITDVTKKIV